MPASYAIADSDVRLLCQSIIEKYHTDLDSAAAKVDLLMAFRDVDKEEPALLKDKVRILGSSKTISLKDRVKGMGDCEIVLDGDAWPTMTAEAKAALMDHQLECFEVKRDKSGDFLFDDISRPVIKMRAHDSVIRFFDTVALRHGKNSIEADQLRSMFLKASQIYLPFVPSEESPAALDQNIDSVTSTMRISVDGAEPVEMTRSQFAESIARKLKDAKEGK